MQSYLRGTTCMRHIALDTSSDDAGSEIIELTFDLWHLIIVISLPSRHNQSPTREEYIDARYHCSLVMASA